MGLERRNHKQTKHVSSVEKCHREKQIKTEELEKIVTKLEWMILKSLHNGNQLCEGRENVTYICSWRDSAHHRGNKFEI